MAKFVLDSDALIKITKSNLLNIFTKEYTCLITQEVYNECVVKGKDRAYEDAFIIEEAIKNKQVKIKKVKVSKDATGELSSLELVKKERGVIVSDDRKFISVLEEQEIRFLVPTDIINLLYQSKKIDKKTALKSLDKIKDIITEHDYKYTKENLK